MTISNTEKQARYRKKEALKQRAGQIFRLLQLGSWNLSDATTPEVIQYNLDKITDLPPDWTDDDYKQAAMNLENFYIDFFSSGHLIENDVKESIGGKEEFFAAQNAQQYIKDERAAIAKAREISSHIISALRLSDSTDSVKAAALMEVVRFVGRTLANDKNVRKTKATTVCLASIGPGYDRPKWFSDSMAELLGWQLGKDLAHEVGKKLMKFDYKK